MKKVAKKATKVLPSIIKVKVISDTVFGVNVLRGYARLCDLSRISKADIFDQKTNPLGTQRDLSPKHARDAYQYGKSKEIGFWPEIFLCLRNKNVAKFSPLKGNSSFGELSFDCEKISKIDGIAISRVDGNHRLHYASGDVDGYPAITRSVSFCLALDLTLEHEIMLFRDINDNQRRMNTSHLDNIAARLSPEDRQKRENPSLYIAKRLGEDSGSPFYQLVYEGGKKAGSFMVPLRSLRSGIQYMLSQPTKLSALPDVDAQYHVVKNYFLALRQWEPMSWEEPNKHLLLRGVGLWATCFVGATVADRVLGEGNYSAAAMFTVLASGKKWDWRSNGDFAGFSGRGGAIKVRDMIVREFSDPSGISISSLMGKILDGSD